jgi:hypothetical protein
MGELFKTAKVGKEFHALILPKELVEEYEY